MGRTASFLLVIAILFSCTAFGQQKGKEKAEKEKMRQANIVDVRDAVTDAVLHLRIQAIKDSDDFFVPPKRTRKVVDRKEFTRRYRRVTREKPVYEYEYETYTTMTTRKSGDSVGKTAKLKKVKKRRRVGRKQVGTKKVTKLVRDKDGPIERTHTRPVYGPGGPDKLRPGWYAQNAMAVYLMLQAGVDPKDMKFTASVSDLAAYTDGFDLPDRTVELAWLTAAFVNVPKKDNRKYEKLRKKLVNKLLLGQIEDGPAEGMWGPVCIDPELLHAMINAEQEMQKEHITQWKKELREDRDDEDARANLEEGKQIVDAFHKKIGDFYRRGLDFQGIRRGTGRRIDSEYRNRVGIDKSQDIRPSVVYLRRNHR